MSTTTTTTVTKLASAISITTPAETTTQPVGTRPVQTYSTHHPNIPYKYPIDPNRQASATQSTTQHAAATSYSPTTILPTHLAYTSTGHISSTTTAPLNSLSNSTQRLRERRFTQRQIGFRARTRPTPRQPLHPRRSDITGLLAQTQLRPTLMRMQRKHGDRPCCDKDPSSCALRTFRTVLLTARARGRRLELDAEDGVRVRNVTLSDKEKGLSISGVKLGASPALPSTRLSRWKWQVEVKRRKKGMR